MITMGNLNNVQFSFKIMMKLGVKDTNDKRFKVFFLRIQVREVELYILIFSILLSSFMTEHFFRIFLKEIDGGAFMLLNSDMMMKYLGLKLGPVLKLSNIIEKLKGKKSSH